MENILDKEPVKRVHEFITKFDPNLKVLVLDTTARTAKDAATLLKCEVGAIVKSLLFRADETFLICLIAGDKRCSLNKLKKIVEKKDVCMADADEVKSITGFSIGGVAPIAHSSQLNILIDQSLSRFQNVFAAAGHPNSIFKINFDQLVQMTKGEVIFSVRLTSPSSGVRHNHSITRSQDIELINLDIQMPEKIALVGGIHVKPKHPSSCVKKLLYPREILICLLQVLRHRLDCHRHIRHKRTLCSQEIAPSLF